MLDKRILKAEEVLKKEKENVNKEYRLGYHIMALFNIKENIMRFINIILMMKTGGLCIGDMLKVRI